ncbi:MAG: 50S ribosomal protein L29 [Planctomycetota bacterium]|nr:50S ribosomal protein L29 [Planctomycetota bacterium]MCX8040831.1 50S ribosomal protein L29 [Planctomycetota bacterium]MDW8372282.1 50S ribosomal protein L29 [Planctomycetota bacterium]
MKRSLMQELRAKTDQQLREEVERLRSEMLKARIASALEGKRLGMRTRANRRQVARILTILRERELAQQRQQPKGA